MQSNTPTIMSGFTLLILTARGALIHYLTRSAMQPNTPTITSGFTVPRRLRLAVYNNFFL
jgi:hypothetical protein